MLWLGAKRLVFTSVDPHNPEYFFTGNSELALNIYVVFLLVILGLQNGLVGMNELHFANDLLIVFKHSPKVC